jgi:hypothetical protein
LQDRRQVAAVAAGDEAVALADRRGDVGDLEALGLARVDRAAERSNAFMKNERTKNGWRRRASAFSISSFTANRRSGLIALLRERVAVEDGGGGRGRRRCRCAARRARTSGLVAVADGLDQQVLELFSSKTSPRMSKTGP